MTRAQFVTMLAGLAGADVSNCPATPFRDVPEGAWYAPYVNWALANGIVSGTSAVTFSPDASITRQDMAVMLYSYTQRFQVHLQQQPVTPFTDAGSIAAYAQIAVQTLQRAGVISGMPGRQLPAVRNRYPRTGLHHAVHAVMHKTVKMSSGVPGGRFSMRDRRPIRSLDNFAHLSKSISFLEI